jgi:hypothetical protein
MRCRYCQKKIRLITLKHNGHAVPVELRPASGDGEKTLITEDGERVLNATPEVVGFELHKPNCKTE